MTDQHVRVITACTSRKVSEAGVLAERLYSGDQHRRLMEGVDRARRNLPVEVWVISAKWGVVSGSERLGPYDESFAGLSPGAAREEGARLAIPRNFRDVAEQPCALQLVLAGNQYFYAAGLDEIVDWGAPTVLLLSAQSAARCPSHPLVRVLALGQSEAKRFGLPLTVLKGELAKRILQAPDLGGARLLDSDCELFDHVDVTSTLSAAN
jgi:hypothetical protein